MRKSVVLLTVAVAAFASAACSSTDEGAAEVKTGTSRGAIIGGKVSTAEQDAVVLLIHTDRQTSFGACTGTLIAPNLLLTARHCVSAVVDAGVVCNADGTSEGPGARVGASLKAEEFYIFTGTERPSFGRDVKVAAKGKKVYHDGAKNLCGHDLALILLDQDVEGAAIAPLRLDALPTPGESLTAVGWGVTDKSQSPAKRQQRSGIKIEAVGPVEGSRSVAPLPPNDFRVGESICSGDSGGPGFAEDTGAIIGVVSRGGNGTQDQNDPAAGCVGEYTQNEYTAVAPFKDLILSAFEEAGHEPWVEGQPDPRLTKFDEACSEGSECRSGVCNAGKCSQTCEDKAGCPDGFECAADGASKICKVAGAPLAANPSSSGGGCVAGTSGPVGPVVPWVFAALAGLAARRRRKP